MKLTTDRQIAALKPAEKPFEARVAGARGLLVVVYPSGAKSWFLRFVAPDGSRKRLLLGPYPGLGLADARLAANDHQVAVAKGRDPAAELAKAKETARTGETLAELVDAYFEAAKLGLHSRRGKAMRDSTVKVQRSRLDLQVLPKLGDRKFAGIESGDIVRLIEGFVKAKKLAADTINSIRRTLNAVFAFAVRKKLIGSNPVDADEIPRPAEVGRDRLFSNDSLKLIWSALKAAGAGERFTSPVAKDAPDKTGEPSRLPVERVTALALQFITLTLCRRSETASMEWSEIDWDAKTWLIPASRAKSGRPYVVMLSEAALSVLREAKALQARADTRARRNDETHRFAFESPGHLDRHIDPHAITRSLTRLCDHLGIPHGSPHDLRRTGASILTGTYGHRRFFISQVLNHAHSDGGAVVSSVYDRYTYAAEKRALLEDWAGHLSNLVSGNKIEPSNVVAFAGGRAA